MKKNLLALCLLSAHLHGDISAFDDEDMRALRASDPFSLLTFPPEYAFTQALQTAKNAGFQFFSLVFFECKIGSYRTKAQFAPLNLSGKLLNYKDRWIEIELLGYQKDPQDPDAFEVDNYEIDLHPLSDDEDEE